MSRQPLALGVCLTVMACGPASRPGPAATAAPSDAAGQPARILSASFGLDDALPGSANRYCPGAGARNGMPVVLSHTIDPATLQREDFRVITHAGAERTPVCVTVAPAADPGEMRTVLLAGDFGGTGDPPSMVRIVADILSDGATGGPVNFQGHTAAVIPLSAGPTMVLAEVVPREEWEPSGKDAGSACPAETVQSIRVTWSDAVRRPDGSEAGEAVRTRYRVVVERPDGRQDVVVPAALADLDDRDNNHRLCLSTGDTPTAVSFPAGHLVDPNGDVNSDTLVAVQNSATIGSFTREGAWQTTQRTPIWLIRRTGPAPRPNCYRRCTTSFGAWPGRAWRANPRA